MFSIRSFDFFLLTYPNWNAVGGINEELIFLNAGNCSNIAKIERNLRLLFNNAMLLYEYVTILERVINVGK